jgi:hypothetical protein
MRNFTTFLQEEKIKFEQKLTELGTGLLKRSLTVTEPGSDFIPTSEELALSETQEASEFMIKKAINYLSCYPPIHCGIVIHSTKVLNACRT